MSAPPNRVGHEANLEFWGASFVYDPYGNLLHRAPHDREEIVSVSIATSRSLTRRGPIGLSCGIVASCLSRTFATLDRCMSKDSLGETARPPLNQEVSSDFLPLGRGMASTRCNLDRMASQTFKRGRIASRTFRPLSKIDSRVSGSGACSCFRRSFA